MNMFKIYEQFISSERPSDYLTYLKNSNKLKDFPELLSLIITPQEPNWHPEGSVWTHTLMVVDVAAELRSELSEENQIAELMFGALCHDLGKPYSTIYSKGKLKSPMHDSLGVPPSISLLSKLGLERLIPKVTLYVIEHLKPIHLFNSPNVSDTAIARLAERIDVYDLVRLSKADHWGRTDGDARNRVYPAGDWLIDRYRNLTKNKKIRS